MIEVAVGFAAETIAGICSVAGLAVDIRASHQSLIEIRSQAGLSNDVIEGHTGSREVGQKRVIEVRIKKEGEAARLALGEIVAAVETVAIRACLHICRRRCVDSESEGQVRVIERKTFELEVLSGEESEAGRAGLTPGVVGGTISAVGHFARLDGESGCVWPEECRQLDGEKTLLRVNGRLVEIHRYADAWRRTVGAS